MKFKNVPKHREAHHKVGGSLKEAVFGFNDGVVSTFAVIAGLTGGLVESKTVLLGALATLVAGAFSMGLGTYLGSKAEKELYERERKRELHEMKHLPEIERQEIYEIYEAKGFKGEFLDKVVDQIISDQKLWLETMMKEELGFAEEPPKPALDGIVMSTAFTVGSAIATLPYIFPKLRVLHFDIYGLPEIFMSSLILSIIGLLFVGGFKTKFTGKNILLSALETLLVGIVAAGGTYGVGLLFGATVG